MFDKEFVKSLPQDSISAAVAVCDHYNEFCRGHHNDFKKKQNIDNYIGALAFLEFFVNYYLLDVTLPSIGDINSTLETIDTITLAFKQIDKYARPISIERKRRSHYELARDQYASMFGKGIFYEFSDSDFDKIQGLLNNLRELLTKSDDLEEDHRRRLLKRLEALQSELHKKMSNFDKFWGFAVDSSFAFRKVWGNSKPFIDDVKEIMQIVCHVQAKTENVQKSFPLNAFLKSADDGEAD